MQGRRIAARCRRAACFTKVVEERIVSGTAAGYIRLILGYAFQLVFVTRRSRRRSSCNIRLTLANAFQLASCWRADAWPRIVRWRRAWTPFWSLKTGR